MLSLKSFRLIIFTFTKLEGKIETKVLAATCISHVIQSVHVNKPGIQWTWVTKFLKAPLEI